MITVPLTLESPEIVAANARGVLNADQRRVLARDFYREGWKTPVAAIGWVVMSLVMLRILLPVAGDIVPRLLADGGRGRVPVRFGTATVTLPLWAMLQWFLALLTLAYIIAFAVQVKRLVAFLRLRHALLYGRIASVVGAVWYRDGQPLAIFADRQIRPWDVRVLAGIAPGRYRFYLLPRFDWLLSGERIPDWARPTADEDALAARHSLSIINGFDPAALPENRAGRLTPGQARLLRASAPDVGWRLIVLYGFAIAVGVTGAGVYAREALEQGITNDRLGGIGAGGAWAAIWVYLLVKQFRDNARQLRDADAGRVLVYEGPVGKWEGWKYSQSDHSSPWIYRYEYGGEQWEVSQGAFRALADGLIQRAYYTPHSKQLVNIELAPLNAGASGQPPGVPSAFV